MRLLTEIVWLTPCIPARVVLSEDMIKEAIPGNIRKAEHFVAFLKRFVEYMKVSRDEHAAMILMPLIKPTAFGS